MRKRPRRISLAHHSRFLDREPPGATYHYTSAQGLLGILSNRSLWLSDCRFLNDADELHHSDRRALSVVEASKLSSRTRSRLRRIVEQFVNWSTLTASFSENGDLLSQWRAYCPLEGGYSIGFSKDFWRKLDSPCCTAFKPCIYDPREQHAILRDILLKISSDFELHYRMVRPCMKNRSFEEEREWRIISLDPPDIIDGLEFRSAKGKIVPYCEWHFVGDALPITEIIVGPCVNQSLAANGVRHLLRSLSMPNIEVRLSTATLR